MMKEVIRDRAAPTRGGHLLIEGQISTDDCASTAVYTDGYKNITGNTKSYLCVPSHDFPRSYRVTDGSSVLAAEMGGMSRAIEWETTANVRNVLIFQIPSERPRASKPAVGQQTTAAREPDKCP